MSKFELWWYSEGKSSSLLMGEFSSVEEAEAAMPAAKADLLGQCGDAAQREAIESGTFTVESEGIVYEGDTDLTVYIDRRQASAVVRYAYAGNESEGATPFQTADMPIDDQAAAKKVNDWLEMQS